MKLIYIALFHATLPLALLNEWLEKHGAAPPAIRPPQTPKARRPRKKR